MDADERSAAVHAAGSAVAQVARTAGEVHQDVLGIVGALLPPLPAAGLSLRANALIARACYATVATSAQLVAALAAPALAASAEPDATPAHHRPESVRWLAALSGAVGDSLRADARTRSLTVPMGPRDRGAPVRPRDRDVPMGPRDRGVPVRPRDPDVPCDAEPGGCAERHGTLAVLVHGLGCHESNWGAQVLAAVGDHAHVLTVRYTTGQPIAASGAELAGLLDTIAGPPRIQRIVLVGHSMGGLVIREALARGGHWRSRVTDAVTLGTPHTGAPLERGARALLRAASAYPVAGPLAALGDARSAGIKDLAEGGMAPPAPDVDWHLVAGTIGPPTLQHRLGDGMVGISSALDARRGLAARRMVIRGAGHLALLEHPQVADLLTAIVSSAGTTTVTTTVTPADATADAAATSS